jgi:hypothetical protein
MTTESIEQLDDYTYEPQSAGGKYLRLKEKNQKVRIRIISKPIRFYKHFDARDDKPAERKEMFAWLVLDKTQAPFTVKAFEAGLMVYLGIKQFAQDVTEWGDPTQYDLIIERTEKQGSYYTVKPSNKGMGPLGDDERDIVADSDLDLVAMFSDKPSDAPSAAPQPSADEYDPFADE